jgi:hypothetical protein
MMDTINAIIVRRQSTHEMSPSNATRKTVAISIKATRRPWQRMQQGHCESNVSITMILIPLQWLLPQGHQSPQCVRNKCKLHCFANQRRSQGLYAQCNDGNYCHHQHGRRKQHKLRNDGGRGGQVQQQKSPPSARTRTSSPDAYMVSTPITPTMSAALICTTKRTNNSNLQAATTTTKHSRGDTCTTQHHAGDDCWTSSKLSRLAEPGTPSPVRKEQAHKQEQQKIPCWEKSHYFSFRSVTTTTIFQWPKDTSFSSHCPWISIK